MGKSKEWENARRGIPVNISEGLAEKSSPKVTEEELDQCEKLYTDNLKKREDKKMFDMYMKILREDKAGIIGNKPIK